MLTQNTPFRKDWFLLGFATGAVSSIGKNLANLVLYEAGVPTLFYGSMASGMMLGKRDRFGGLLRNGPRNRGEWAIGYMADAMLGGVFGAGLAYLHTKTPPGNELAKGAITGALLGGTTLVGGRMMKLDALARATPAQSIAVVATSAIFGALQGAVLGRMGSSMIAQSHPIMVQQTSRRAFDRERVQIAGPTR